MDAKRSKFFIEVTVETQGLSDDEHEQRARWARRNMASRNADMEDTFLLIAVRDESGDLIEISGTGRGKPSSETQKVWDSLMREAP